MNEIDPGKKPGFLTTPLSAKGWPRWVVFLMAGIGFLYILNPTLGVFELIPDNFPIVGNLDEGLASMLIWLGLVEFFEGKYYARKADARDKEQPQDVIDVDMQLEDGEGDE